MTVLRAFAQIFLIGLIIYTIANYETLSGSGGWGIVGMIGLTGIGIVALIIDFVLRGLLGSNKKWINIIGAIIALVALISILYF